jgi:hypothetical protein
LFANVVAHFGVNYGYYMMVYFFVLLGAISVVTLEARYLAAAQIKAPGDSDIPSVPDLVSA